MIPASMPELQHVGPYRIVRTIAQGGMGEVCLATLEREGGFRKQVAIKRALPGLMQDPLFVELFEKEARLAAALNHRNIVQIFDFGRSDGAAWIAMEYVEGLDLKAVLDHLGGTPLPLGRAVEIGLSCARALHYAHEATDAGGHPLHVIHRDVSPQNVLLSFAGDVKLADFGLAHAMAHGRAGEGPLRGKYAYMSPEQLDGGALDARSDIFSLGAVLFEAFTGRRAFYAEDGTEQVLARVRRAETVTPLEEAAPDLPPALADVVRRALARAPADRFPDAAALENALHEAADVAGVEVGAPGFGAWLRAQFPNRSAPTVAATPVEATEAAAAPIAAPVTPQPVVTPAPVRRRARWPWFALVALAGVAAAYAVAIREAPPVAPRIAMATAVDAAPADARPPAYAVRIPDAARRGVAAVVDASPPDAAGEAPRPVHVVTPRPPPRRPTPPDAALPAAPLPAAPPVVAVMPAEPAPAAPPAAPGPRVRITARGARVRADGGGAASGWLSLADGPLLLRVVGGHGPPVRIRLQARGGAITAGVDARPWGELRLDGHDMGSTPIASLPLRAGERKLEVTGPEGRATVLELEVEP